MQAYMTMLLSLLIIMMAEAQSIKVIDDGTGEPLVGVTVTTEVEGPGLTTDLNGEVDISSIAGAEKIVFSYLGYETRKISTEKFLDGERIIPMWPDDMLLDEVIVSATKWGQRRRDVPSKISSIGAEDIKLNNPQTSADMLGINDEVFIQKSQQGGGSPMIRGFSTNRLLYSVDGIRMNTAIFRSGNIQNVISIDPFSVESTEILFGPGSVIYGSDAIGGVMSFQTLSASTSSNKELEVSGRGLMRHATANKEVTGHFDLNLGWEKWASRTSVSSFNFDDLRMGRFGPDDYLDEFYVERLDDKDVVVINDDPLVQRPTGYGQINLMQKVRFVPSEIWTIEATSIYSTTTNLPRYDRLVRTTDDVPRSAVWEYGPQVWSLNYFAAEYTGNNAFFDKMSLKMAYQYFEESRIDRDLGSERKDVRSEEVMAYSTNLDFYKTIQSDMRLYYGLEWVHNDVESKGEVQIIGTDMINEGPSRYPDASWRSYAAYLTAHHNIADHFGWQVGVRYSYFDMHADFSKNLMFYPLEAEELDVTNGAFSGSLGALWRPSSSSVVSLNISSGFRAPNVDDVGKVFDSEPGSVVVPNPDLKPEQAFNFEIGLAKRFGGHLKLDASFYYTILDDAMVRRDFVLNGRDSIMYDGELSQVQAIQNAARATVFGCQLSVEYKFLKNWSWITHFNYQKGEEELENGNTSPSRHAAPVFGTSKLQFRKDRLSLDLGVVANGERSFEDLPFGEQNKTFLYASDDRGRPYSPAWYTVNFHFIYEVTEELTFSGGIENITDQRYRPYSSGISGAGRNFIAGLQLSF